MLIREAAPRPSPCSSRLREIVVQDESTVPFQEPGATIVDGMSSPSFVLPSPDGAHVFVGSSNDDTLLLEYSLGEFEVSAERIETELVDFYRRYDWPLASRG